MSKVYRLKYRSNVTYVRKYWADNYPEAKLTELVNPSNMDEVCILIENGRGFRKFEETMFNDSIYVLPV